MEAYDYLAAGVILGLVVICVSIYLWKNTDRTSDVNWLDVVIVWPLIFKREKRAERPTSKRFVIIGALLYVVIVCLGIKFG